MRLSWRDFVVKNGNKGEFQSPAIGVAWFDRNSTVVRSQYFQAPDFSLLRNDIFYLVTISHDRD